MENSKCEYCGVNNFKTENENLVCAQCGAPLPDIVLVQKAQLFALKIDRKLSQETYARIHQTWKDIFNGTTPPRLIILEDGIDLVPLKLEQ